MHSTYQKPQVSKFIFLKYYSILQIPLALIMFSYLISEFFSDHEGYFLYFSLVMFFLFFLVRVLFGVLYYIIYRMLQRKECGFTCYILLFICLFDFVLGTLLAVYTLYRLFTRKTDVNAKVELK